MSTPPTDSRPSTPAADAATEAVKPAARADDLISEMAGKEIDRMLADAGIASAEGSPDDASSAESAPSAPASKPPDVASSESESPLPVAAPAVEPIEKELDQIVDRQLGHDADASDEQSASAPPASPGATAESSVGADAGGSLAVDDLLHRLAAGERAEPPSATPASPAPSIAVAPGVETAPPRNDGDRASSSRENTSASDDPVADAPAAEATPPLVLSASTTDRLPGLLGRAVDLLASPLDPFPDRVRDLVGKVAIVTALNAAAVLAYVVFFRK